MFRAMRFAIASATIGFALFVAAGCGKGAPSKTDLATADTSSGSTPKPDGESSAPNAGGKSLDSESSSSKHNIKQAREISAVVEEVEPSVVRFDVKTDKGAGIGSGFVVSEDGLAVTNHHVIKGALSANATFHNGSTAKVSGILHADKERDIAVVRLLAAGKLSYLKVSDKAPKRGEPVIALGAPQGLSFSVTEGIVSAIRSGEEMNEFGKAEAGTWIQTSTPISPGNSGGPLVNRDGAVVGANTFTLRNSQNLNFSISSIDILEVIEIARSATETPLKGSTVASKSPKEKGKSTSQIDKSVPLDDKDSAVAKLLEDRDARLKEIASVETKIAEERNRLKDAIIAGDEKEELSRRNAIRASRGRIDELTQRSLPIATLNLLNLTTGETGTLKGSQVLVVQVTNKARGECISVPLKVSRNGTVIPVPSSIIKSVILRGVDLSSVADRETVSFSDSLFFVVKGTETYTTTSGGTNTVFVVEASQQVKELIAELKDYKSKEPEEPTLTEDEKQVVAERQKVIAERQKKAADATELQKRETRARSTLANAKVLIKGKKLDAAKKWLDEIVRDYADTESAKEAKDLLYKVKRDMGAD